MIRVEGVGAARRVLVRSDPLDALRGTARVLEGIMSLFGEALTPAQVVERIIADVRRDGDAAVARYTTLTSGIRLERLEVSRAEIERATSLVEPGLLSALRTAADRVRRFHQSTLMSTGTRMVDAELGLRCLPLGRVGLYVPGGRYSYPSSVLMSAIPARVAGVGEIVVATPAGRGGAVPPATLAACHLAGVDRVFAMGGAQAIAAMAYGTASVPRVDKICGPGNIFVTIAKRMVFGSVGIDSLAGPSEVLIIADESASPDFCAADLLAQAEHDPEARVVLVTTSARLADAVENELVRQVETLAHRAQVAETLESGIVAVVGTLDEAVQLSNEFAPEHLELLVDAPSDLLRDIRNAGCICLGGESPVVMGDYVDGPSHVLPTGGAARFLSVLGVHDFVKYSSVARLTGVTMADLGPTAAVIAGAEGLEAHARAIEKRLHRDS